MIGIFSVATLALSAVIIGVQGAAITPPSISSVESYASYEARFISWGCSSVQTSSLFYLECCHPMPAGETVALAFPASCSAGTSTPSSAATPNILVVSSTTGTATHSTPATSTAHVTSTSTPLPQTTSAAAAQIYSGEGSWYAQDGTPGACGITYSDSDMIVALSSAVYGSSAISEYCGKSVTVSSTTTGQQAVAVVADVCENCPTSGSLEMSEGFFEALGADTSVGSIDVMWHLVN